MEVDWAQSIGFGNNWDQVDPGTKPLHNLDIEGLQSVAGGADEVQASVDAEIDLVGTARLLFLQHVRFVLVVQELDDWLPGVTVVDIVAKAGGIDDSQAHYCRVWSVFSRSIRL